MIHLNVFLRLFYFPLGFINQLKLIGINGSRDFFNRTKFKRSIIDNGCCIDPLSIIHPNVHLLEKCIINSSEINSYTYLGKNCLVQNASIGKFCSIANEVLIGLGSHPLDLISTSPLFYKKKNPLQISLVEKDVDLIEYKPISIGNDVWIGTRAIIMDGVSIGHGAVIAANAVVTKDIPPYAIAAGVPAKIVKYRFSSEKISEMVESKWWEKDLVEIFKKNHV